MGKKQEAFIGRRVFCPDGVKGTIDREVPAEQSPTGLLAVLVLRDDHASYWYNTIDLSIIQPRTHTMNLDPGERLERLVAEMEELRAAAERFEALKNEVKAAIVEPAYATGVAWEDGDSIEVCLNGGRAVVRAYMMRQRRVDATRMQAEAPELYEHFLTQTSAMALRGIKPS